MTNGISIKIHNAYGVNSIKGTDISKEETLELIGLARELVAQQAPLSLVTPVQYSEGLPLDEVVEAIKEIPATVSSRPSTVRPAPIKAKTVSPYDDTPIKLGSTPNPDVKRIVPRQPVVVEEPTPEPVVEPDEKVYSTPGTTAVNSLADKLVDTFQESQGIAPLTTATTEFLPVNEQLAELNKDYYATGIKYKVYGGEVTPMYRVRCQCPTCGTKGNHYILETKKDVNCFDCSTSMLVEQATEKFLGRDDWGNFFVANKVNPRWRKA